MEKNGITVAVYLFTKRLVLHVGHACADLEGKEVGKGGGAWAWVGHTLEN